MNDDTRQMMQETLVKIKDDIARLEAVKGSIQAALASMPVAHQTKPQRGPRAPKGALEEAIRSALKGKGGFVNREIRARLVKAGYEFSLDPLHVGKTLAAMVDAKELTIAHDGTRREYSLR